MGGDAGGATCQACGGLGQACCGRGNVVNVGNGECTAAGSGCVLGDGGISCGICGAIGQPCCNNVTCNVSGAVCAGPAGTPRTPAQGN